MMKQQLWEQQHSYSRTTAVGQPSTAQLRPVQPC